MGNALIVCPKDIVRLVSGYTPTNDYSSLLHSTNATERHSTPHYTDIRLPYLKTLYSPTYKWGPCLEVDRYLPPSTHVISSGDCFVRIDRYLDPTNPFWVLTFKGSEETDASGSKGRSNTGERSTSTPEANIPQILRMGRHVRYVHSTRTKPVAHLTAV